MNQTIATLVAVAMALLVWGCEGLFKQTYSVDRGQFNVLYSDMKYKYGRIQVIVEQLCESKGETPAKLNEEHCKEVTQINEEMIALDEKIKQIILLPPDKLDLEKIGEFTQKLLSLAAKAAI